MEIVSLQTSSKIPIYKQIVNSIEDSVAKGKLKKGDKLPSLNGIKDNFGVSRDTVLTAFNELKNRGIINSVVGKGYYLASENIVIKQKVFLLFDELNSFKEDLYNAFLQKLGANIQVDIFFHHFNASIFKKLIADSIGNYSYYVIMPANLKETEKVIENLPKEKVYILDQVPESLNSYAAIYQNFEADIENGLFSGINKIKKYNKIILIFPEGKQPKGILKGFQKFCIQNKMNYEIDTTVDNRSLHKGEIYFVLEDKDLIKLIKKIKEKRFAISREVGIISLNDTILKEVVADGITTISTDFKLMGQKLAEMILSDDKSSIENPSKLIIRNSI